MKNVIRFLLSALVWYIVFTFINLNYDPLQWGIWSRSLYSIGAVLSLLNHLNNSS